MHFVESYTYCLYCYLHNLTNIENPGSPQLLLEYTQNSAVFAVEVVCSALSTQKTLSLFYCSCDSCKAIVEKTMEKKKKRQSAVCIVFCHSDTLQSPCSEGYDLWTSLHVVRT